ncbi:MAG: hypothetical protein CMN31_21825 [Sandaracinus sp.]|nr:hypothetical protein [Sandaracinus sp.]
MDAFSRPWILARLATGLVAVVLCAVAVSVAFRVLRHWRIGATSEGQLALERRAELAATLVQLGLILALTGLTLTVLAADRSAQSIRGAMCAWGVFDSTGVGFWPLATGAAASLACALWLVLHRLDLRLATPVLTRRKFLALFAVAPLVWLDFGVSAAFLAQLDFEVVASCCSVSLDGGAAGRWGAEGGHGAAVFGLALVLALTAAAALWATRRSARRGRVPRASAYAAAGLSVAAAGAMAPAVLLYVAPHAYELPHHLCPFCLLHADVGGVGWPLFTALFAATALGAGAGVVAALRKAAGDDAAVAALAARLGRWGAWAWTAAALIAMAPVVRYWIVSGGAPLMH